VDYTSMIEELGGIHAASSMGRPAVATRLGISEWKARRLIDHLRALREADGGIVSAPRLDGREPIENLLIQQAAAFNRKYRAARQGCHTVKVKDNLPVAVAHLGDVHIGDPGCDIPTLHRWMRAVKNTPGMYAATVGDLTNNWPARHHDLYGEQDSSQETEFRLARWLLTDMHWLYVQLGNHDLYNQGVTIYDQMMRDVQCEVYEKYEARIEIQWADAALPVSRIVARHDFSGSSQYNGVVGALKRARSERGWADLYICGHKHNMTHYAEEIDGKVVNCIRVTGFKVLDTYADALGYAASDHGHGCVTIHDPHAPLSSRLKVMWDPEEAAERLTWLRKRRATA
jgi:hypothetical protein